MKSYTDEWVEDSVLMNFLSASGCTCCTLSSQTTLLRSYVQQCSDLDTDSEGRDAIIKAHTLWPIDISMDIWRERIQFRGLLKATVKQWLPIISKDDVIISTQQHYHHQQQQQQEQQVKTNVAPTFLQYWENLLPVQRQEFFNFTTSFLHSTLKASQISNHYFSLLRFLLIQLSQFPRTKMNLNEESGSSNEHSFASHLFHTENLINVSHTPTSLEAHKVLCTCQQKQSQESKEALSPVGNSPECFVCIQYFDDPTLAINRLRDLLYEKKFVPKIHDQLKGNNGTPLHRKNVSLRSDRRLIRIFIFLLGMSNALKSFMDQYPSGGKK
jgi:hypothetical protein